MNHDLSRCVMMIHDNNNESSNDSFVKVQNGQISHNLHFTAETHNFLASQIFLGLIPWDLYIF